MTGSSGLLPMEFNVVIALDPTQEKTAGGIIMPASKTDRDEMAMDEGTIEAASPHAFTYAEWPAEVRQPRPGDRVLFARYAGALHERGGAKFRVVKDKDIVAVVELPPALAVAA